ncbi:unnamed protein product [Rotaria sp. Silwood1]|nr:unnamed protein product [Rotaria sp. Silwood1]CAF1616215.1 unnamed protein product [Rotaria sp. Silwood1]
MKKTHQLQNDLISDIDQPTGNEHFTYKERQFAGPSYQKLSNFLEQQNTDVVEDTNDYYQIIHNSFLLELMKQSICISCKSIWNGDMSVAQREGLYCSLVFTCHCSNEIKINTSKQCPKTSQRDINIRSAIGANFAGIGHQDLVKLCGVLNVPPPIDDDHFSRTITRILPVFESHKLNSMKNAIEKACDESNKRKLTVLDLERLSKSCSICTGALSIKHSNPTKYEEIKNKHKCKITHSGSSASRWEQLVSSLNLKTFLALDNTIRCPDCADGGAEWIQVDWLDGTKHVTFDYGRTIDGIEDLIKKLRQIREEYASQL